MSCHAPLFRTDACGALWIALSGVSGTNIITIIIVLHFSVAIIMYKLWFLVILKQQSNCAPLASSIATYVIGYVPATSCTLCSCLCTVGHYLPLALAFWDTCLTVCSCLAIFPGQGHAWPESLQLIPPPSDLFNCNWTCVSAIK